MKRPFEDYVKQYGPGTCVIALEVRFMDHLHLTGGQQVGMIGLTIAYAVGMRWSEYYEEKL